MPQLQQAQHLRQLWFYSETSDNYFFSILL